MATPTPPRARRKRLGRWLVILLPIVFAVSLILWFASLHWLARAIVYAPNQGKTRSQLSITTPDELDRLGVQHAFRYPVSPPPAEIAGWIMDPTPPRRTAPPPPSLSCTA